MSKRLAVLGVTTTLAFGMTGCAPFVQQQDTSESQQQNHRHLGGRDVYRLLRKPVAPLS